eukprot:TRINITY_DN2767_c0_g1_i2.p1 TRINITY_DN2767_c0_g1~~TRINITY_DN2767_c0_g1_i2.p1  ORF type:complete len:376 (+),score=81.31 TRINITY_DN2767_c0_g1_i2:40-1167(+)
MRNSKSQENLDSRSLLLNQISSTPQGKKKKKYASKFSSKDKKKKKNQANRDFSGMRSNVKPRTLSVGYRSVSLRGSRRTIDQKFDELQVISSNDENSVKFIENLSFLDSSSEEDLEANYIDVDEFERLIEGKENRIIYLNIGGYNYTTDLYTIYRHHPNYFVDIIEGEKEVLIDDQGRYFINRPGKYFKPILEFMIIGEVVIDEEINKKALVREARFYGIDFPLDETHESLSFVTDEWIHETSVQKSYLRLGKEVDELVKIVLNQFVEKADKYLTIESDPILIGNQQVVDEWLDGTEYGKGNGYHRTEFIDRQQKLYSQNCVVSDEYYAILSDPKKRLIIQKYFKLNNLSIKIVPVNIHEPGFNIKYQHSHKKAS